MQIINQTSFVVFEDHNLNYIIFIAITTPIKCNKPSRPPLADCAEWKSLKWNNKKCTHYGGHAAVRSDVQ